MDVGLQGKRILISGASRGIGLAIAKTLVAEGARVAICARGRETLDRTLAELGDQAIGRAFDVRDQVAMADWVAGSVETLGGIDGVISNVSTRLDPKSPDWWTDTFEVDLLQHVRLKQLVEPHLGPQSAMLFVASIAAVLTTLPPHEEAYGAMKGALVNLVGQWAAVLGKRGVRVNAVSPGPIEFEGGYWDKVRQANPESSNRAATMAALGRLGTPEEVAAAAVFLISPAASFITGANLRIDGGLVKAANY